jgi:hypothetical protein
MQDLNTPHIPAENTLPFQLGDAYARVKQNTGIHYDSGQPFGADPTPDYIYLQADFQRAIAGTAYRTSRLIVEYYAL